MPVDNIIYSDLDLNLKTHPNKPDRDINALLNAAAVKRSIKHLLLLERYDLPFQVFASTGLNSMLFEPMSVITAGTMMTMIESIIKAHEPRVNIRRIEVIPDYDRNSYDISVYFILNSLGNEDQLSFVLKRPR